MIARESLASLLADARSLRDRAEALNPHRDDSTDAYLARSQEERDFSRVYNRIELALSEAVICFGRLADGDTIGALTWSDENRRRIADVLDRYAE